MPMQLLCHSASGNWRSGPLLVYACTATPGDPAYMSFAPVWHGLNSSRPISISIRGRRQPFFTHPRRRAVVRSWRGGEWRWQDADGQQRGRTGSTKQGNHRYPAFPVLHTTYYLVLVLVRALRFSSGKSQVVPSAARLHPFGRPCPRYSTSRPCSDSSGLVVAQLTDALIHCANAEGNRGTPSQLCRRCSERLVET
ncbi:Os10g0335050 [Oryza sativa Japonica Group]|uniref:Os10g0335050 protein n=2 Tax=Oryza sativa subsp. japonica TaxID=39947 RepID=Q8LMF8_ORYSJ|nr:Hypothetical protein [Oryza sativa Japonica Group]BAT10380.1 Os10g0335050 [Oryza sativa Japonica Group]